MEGPSVHCEENLDQGGQSNTSPHTSSRSSPQPLAAVHKTTTRYKSEMNFKRYHIPKDSEVEPTPRWKDQRDTLTIFQDLLLKINQTIPPSQHARPLKGWNVKNGFGGSKCTRTQSRE